MLLKKYDRYFLRRVLRCLEGKETKENKTILIEHLRYLIKKEEREIKMKPINGSISPAMMNSYDTQIKEYTWD